MEIDAKKKSRAVLISILFATCAKNAGAVCSHWEIGVYPKSLAVLNTILMGGADSARLERPRWEINA